jgi:hypothetical protein
VLFQLPTGKTIYLTVDEYLNLTDADVQYLVSINCGDALLDPFYGSAVEKNTKESYYDFDYLPNDEDEVNNIPSEEEPFDDIIDLGL